uniref:Uncharacterized protein n=1 Tax=Oncorhynchus kisutch TaxID=8019 RepID=A0A8C7DRK6_ONCKI
HSLRRDRRLVSVLPFLFFMRCVRLLPGGNTSPSKDINAILGNINEVLNFGLSKLTSVPVGGAVVDPVAAGVGPAA